MASMETSLTSSTNSFGIDYSTYDSDIVPSVHFGNPTGIPSLLTNQDVNTTQSMIQSDLVDYYYEMSIDIRKYAGGLILFGGVIGNILCICVLQSKYFRRNPSRSLLSLLSLVDIVVILVTVTRLWIMALTNYEIDIRTLSEASCKIHIFLTYFTAHLSSWTLVLINIERVISVYIPFKAREICSKKRLLVGFAVIFAILTGLNAHMFWSFHLTHSEADKRTICIFKDHFSEFWKGTYYWIDFAILSFGPFLMIAICNVMIITALCRMSSKRNEMVSSSDNKRKKDSSSISITSMLLVVSIVFLVCTAPSAIFFLCLDIITKETYDKGNYNDYALFQYIVYDAVLLLSYVNSAINFLMYCFSGKTFRKALIRMCVCKEENKDFSSSFRNSVTATSAV